MADLQVVGKSLLALLNNFDTVLGYVTKTNRQVIKASSPNRKVSMTRYPNGTIVTTTVEKER